MEASALRAPVGLGRISIGAPLLRLRSDEQLVAAFRRGEEAAFQVIHDRYRQRLFAYARQMLGGSRQDAEDVLQDVFLRAYGALRADARPVTLRAWLYRVAHNRCIDQIRRPAPAQADLYDVSRPPLDDPLALVERRDDLRRLIGDVRRLPEAQRSALLMREMEGLTYEELAGALDTTIPAVKSLLVRARMGLVEASEARNVACPEIRRQLALAFDRGVRASGQARRHMRECAGCREYRSELRGVSRRLGALTPVSAGPLGVLAKLGLGGSSAGCGAGAAAGGGCAAGGGFAALTGGATIATAGKVAAIVASVAVVTAGAQEVQQQVDPPAPVHHAAAAPAAAPSLARSVTAATAAAAAPVVAPPSVASATAEAEAPAKDVSPAKTPAKTDPAAKDKAAPDAAGTVTTPATTTDPAGTTTTGVPVTPGSGLPGSPATQPLTPGGSAGSGSSTGPSGSSTGPSGSSGSAGSGSSGSGSGSGSGAGSNGSQSTATSASTSSQ